MLDASIRLGRSPDVATRQYNKAIQALHARLEVSGESQRHCQDVVLLCCLLCTIYECLAANTVRLPWYLAKSELSFYLFLYLRLRCMLIFCPSLLDERSAAYQRRGEAVDGMELR
jgi:hypothetical protein